MVHSSKIIRVLGIVVMLIGSLLASAPPSSAAPDGGQVIYSRELGRLQDVRILFESRRDGTWHVENEGFGYSFCPERTEETFTCDVPSGTYRVSVARAGSPEGSDIARTYFPRTVDVAKAEVITITPGRVVDLTRMIPLPGGHLTGTVLGDDADPPEVFSRVYAMRRDAQGRWNDEGRSEVAADGSFDVPALSTHDYVLRFESEQTTKGGNAPFATTYSGGTTSPETATPVSAEAGESRSAGSTRLVPNGSVAGIIENSHGHAKPGVVVEVEGSGVELATLTDGEGRWAIGSIPAGSYTVTYSHPFEVYVLKRVPIDVRVRHHSKLVDDLEYERPLWKVGPRLVFPGRLGDANRSISVDPGVLLQPEATVSSIVWTVDDSPAGPRVIGSGTRIPAPGPAYDGVHVTATVTAQHEGLTRSIDTESIELRSSLPFRGRPRQSDTTPTVGQRLSASLGTITPRPTTVQWQWLRSGRPIRGATKSTYRVTRADRGRTVVARVKIYRRGYAPVFLRTASKKVTGLPR